MKKMLCSKFNKIIAFGLALCILSPVQVFAGTIYEADNDIQSVLEQSKMEEPYFYAWDEEAMEYIPYENPNYPKENQSFNTNKQSRSNDYELGITLARTSYNVYTSTSTSSTKVGSIGSAKSREIVRVLSETTVNGVKWYQITYKTSSGTKTGYIQASNINIPSRTYNYSKPMTAGTWTQDYGYNNHAGVDIGGGSQNVYAFTGGTVTYKYAKFKNPDDNNWYLISYGNYAQQSPSIGKTTYAHLSSLANGYSASSLPSLAISSSNSLVQNNPSNYQVVIVGSVSVSAGAKIGVSGSTGNSTGTHLHFEISGKDPFDYVLFPDYGYVS